MTMQSIIRQGTPKSVLGMTLATAIAVGLAAATAQPIAAAAPPSARPMATLTLSVGRGQLIQLKTPMSDLFVAQESVADVQVRSPTQLYVFGKGPGETTISATSKSGAVVYAATVRVGTNLDNVQSMLRLAMPDAVIAATPMNGLVLLTGTVATPQDVEEASRLVQAFVGKDTQVLSRLKTATPMQVNLQVKIAEVSRGLIKQIGVNLLSRDSTSGFGFGIGRGSPGTFNIAKGPADPITGVVRETINSATFNNKAGATTLGLAGHLLGLDLLSTIDLAETDGLVTTLAEPNLTALSGETASFLAGGEIPVPQSQGLGAVSVEYKQYGVSLAFTPVVLADGRISLRVRPEVSQLSDAGSVVLNGFTIPGLTTRRAETTVELGSGQSFMIAGLLSNSHNNSIEKAPGLGDLPVLGALFRSNNFKRNETELVIVVTPYLVKPVSAGEIALPTDGYRAPTDFQRIIGGQTFDGKSGAVRPKPRMVPTAPPAPVRPDTGALPPAAVATPPRGIVAKPLAKTAQASATPGFSFN